MQKEYVEAAEQKFGSRGTFIQEAVGEKVNDKWIETFDVINAHGLIHHLSDQDSDTLLQTASKYLKPDGYMVTVDSVYHNKQSRISKWLVSKDRGQNIRGPEGYISLAQKYFKIDRHYITDNHLNIPYSIFTMKLSAL